MADCTPLNWQQSLIAAGCCTCTTLVFDPDVILFTDALGVVDTDTTFTYDGTNFGLGIASPTDKFHLVGQMRIQGQYASLVAAVNSGDIFLSDNADGSSTVMIKN